MIKMNNCYMGRCEFCKFSIKRSASVYLCRRRSPITIHDPATNVGVHQEAFRAKWPTVNDDDWCGDFELDFEKIGIG